MPVNAGSHSSRCVRSRCCDVAMSRSSSVDSGRALWWRVVRRRSKLAGSFPGVQRMARMGGLGWWAEVDGGVCFGACAGGCATTLSIV